MKIAPKTSFVNCCTRGVLRCFVLITIILAVLTCRPANAGHWEVDHYEVSGESYGNASDNPDDLPFENEYWGTHKWNSPYSPPNWKPWAGYGAQADWPYQEQSVHSSGSFTPVFRWVPNPNLASDPPTSKFYVRLTAGASAILTTNRPSDFDRWDWEVENGWDDETSSGHSYMEYWYEQEQKGKQGSVIIEVNNAGGDTMVRLPTSHTVHAKSTLPDPDPQDQYHTGNVMAGVSFSATQVADIKVNGSIEDSNKKVGSSTIPELNKREADGDITVDTRVQWKQIGVTPIGQPVNAWTFDGTFVANPFPAGTSLGFTDPEYTWRYNGEPLKGYFPDNSNNPYTNTNRELAQYLFDKSKADMNVVIGDETIGTDSSQDMNDPEFLKKKFGAKFPVSGNVYVYVTDKDKLDSPTLSKKMQIKWHLPAENIKEIDPMPFNGIMPELTLKFIEPALIDESTIENEDNEVGSLAKEAGVTGYHYNATYFALPEEFQWTEMITQDEWDKIGYVRDGALLAAGMYGTYVVKPIAKAYKFLADPIGGWIASGLSDLGIEMAKESVYTKPFSRRLPKTNDIQNFTYAYDRGQVFGIGDLSQSILATRDKQTYADNMVWSGCKMEVEVVKPTRYHLFTGDSYGYNGYSGPAYLHTRIPEQPYLTVKYTYVGRNDYPDYRLCCMNEFYDSISLFRCFSDGVALRHSQFQYAIKH